MAIIASFGCKQENPIGKWKDGIIPYYLKGNFTDEEVEIIQTGMRDWESVIDIRFIEVTPRAGAYNIRKTSENEWSSSVGENNSDCHMDFGSGGNVYSHVIHELGHALGLLHEHQRPDRDNFVTVFWENIIPSYKSNFEIKDNPLITEENYSYDYNSIMHYPPKSFSINGVSDTMTSVDSTKEINRLGIITDLDIEKATEIYGPPVEEE